jgi:phthiocerol/phenolphthiocerol synthesis type-I polyketide synthase E
MEREREYSGNEIAILGMSARLPGAVDVAALWRRLCSGEPAIRRLSDSELLHAGIPIEVVRAPGYIKAGAPLDGIDQFDAALFKLTPREAEILDPQHRCLLECAWEALEDAGYPPRGIQQSVGVFAGVGMNEYALRNLSSRQDVLESFGALQTAIMNDKDFLTTRISYALNLRGPSVAVQTACSTSLTAVHLACQSLLSGDCRMALAGGVTLKIPQLQGYFYHEGGPHSPDGTCRAFDAAASGTVASNGAGLVALKRLEDALADGDYVQAVILGSAVNNDGSEKVGFTAPSIDRQASVIRDALEMAGVDARSICYVEAHGTGTALGDPIEVAALTQAFRADTQDRHFCALGAIKTMIGHADCAAGIAGLIKACLVLRHRQLPPNKYFERPNPRIDLDASPFYVNKAAEPLPASGALRAGVSSFGIGGTNVHVVLEAAPAREPLRASKLRPQLLPISGMSEAAQRGNADRIARWLEEHQGAELADVACTLQSARQVFEQRSALIAAPGSVRTIDDGVRAASEPPRVVCMFPGGGAQYIGMGKGLLGVAEVFTEQLERAVEPVRRLNGVHIFDLLYGRGPGERLHEVEVALPTLVAFECALLSQLRAWGIEPWALIGHSVGEYAAACAAGVFELEDALYLTHARGKLLRSLPQRTAALVVFEEAARVADRLPEGLSIVAINAPNNVLVGGEADKITLFERELEARGVSARRLSISAMSHCSIVEPILPAFRHQVERTRRELPKLRILSCATADWLSPNEAMEPRYWTAHLRLPVRFSECIARLSSEENLFFVEVGPGKSLSGFVQQHASVPRSRVASTLKHPSDASDDYAVLLEAAARAWMCGVAIDFQTLRGGEGRRVPLPTYAFDRQRYWIDPGSASAAPEQRAIAKRADVADWLYRPVFEHKPRGKPTSRKLRWLLVGPDAPWIAELARALRQRGDELVLLQPSAADAQLSDTRHVADCRDPEQLTRVWQRLRASDLLPDRVVHLTACSAEPLPIEDGFASLVALMRAAALADVSHAYELLLVTKGAVSATAAQALIPEHAALLGLCSVIPQEQPNVRARVIDFAPEAEPEALAAELLQDTDALLCTYVGQTRYERRFQPLLGGAARSLLKRGGHYLLIGGLGLLGRSLSEHLLRNYAAKLTLSGRSPAPDAAALRGLSALCADGASVRYVCADATDEAAMRGLVEGIDGVIHCAAQLGDAAHVAIRDLDAKAVARQFAPKARAVQVLEHALRDRALDFIVLCSSNATFLGGITLGAYASANAYLDAFAAEQQRRGDARWLSLSWDAWARPSDAGAADARLVHSTIAPLAIQPDEGQRVFELALRTAHTGQLVISTADIEARIQQWRAPRPIAGAPRQTLKVHPRPALRTTYAAPRSPREARVCELVQDVLGIERVGIHDSFFELGGSSLLAVQFLARLTAELQRQVQLKTLLERPTVATLSELLGLVSTDGVAPPDGAQEQSSEACLITLRDARRESGLFCIHPAGGTVFCYRQLAGLLDDDLSVYGLQAQGLDLRAPVLKRVESMAERYLREIRAVQPHGSYFLLGHSFGGLVAYELACQLRELGETVAFVGMLDSPGEGQMVSQFADDAEMLAYIAGDKLKLSVERLRGMDLDRQLLHVLEQGSGRGHWSEGLNVGQLRRLFEIWKGTARAQFSYRSRPYPGRLWFFRAEVRRAPHPDYPELAWSSKAEGGIEVHVVPGDHDTMLEPPHVETLAGKLRRALSEARLLNGRRP